MCEVDVECGARREREEREEREERAKQRVQNSKTLPGSNGRVSDPPAGSQTPGETPGETLAGSETPSDKPLIVVRPGDWQEFWREVAKDTSRSINACESPLFFIFQPKII